MSEEELIEILKAFEEKRVEQLPESARNLFYAIMKIADERDLYKKEIEKLSNIINELEKYTDEDDWTSVNGEIAIRLIKLKLQELKGSDK